MSLPVDLLAYIMSFVGTEKEVGLNCALVSRSFYEATNIPAVWESIAIGKYGESLYGSSSALYDYNAKSMLQDDNKRGSILVLSLDEVCYYKHSRREYYFACLVQELRWDRQNQRMYVCLDARGEADLRHPDSSTILIEGAQGDSPQPMEGSWSGVVEEPGHFQGSLDFPAEAFAHAGAYTFCYANLSHSNGDYDCVTLLTVPEDGSLRKAFVGARYEPLDRTVPVMKSEEHSTQVWRRFVESPVFERHIQGNSTGQRFLSWRPRNNRVILQRWWV